MHDLTSQEELHSVTNSALCIRILPDTHHFLECIVLSLLPRQLQLKVIPLLERHRQCLLKLLDTVELLLTILASSDRIALPSEKLIRSNLVLAVRARRAPEAGAGAGAGSAARTVPGSVG